MIRLLRATEIQAIWDLTVLPATLTPAKQAGTPFTYPEGMKGRADSKLAARTNVLKHNQYRENVCSIQSL